jgi:hypothetical protein
MVNAAIWNDRIIGLNFYDEDVRVAMHLNTL